jgi:hypothetical protein
LMKLPNGEAAIVEPAKIRDYCLSQSHPRGRHKARVFQASVGMTVADSQELRSALLRAAREEDAVSGVSDRYGNRYILDFELNRGERTARIRSSWIVLTGENAPRFVTCFIL